MAEEKRKGELRGREPCIVLSCLFIKPLLPLPLGLLSPHLAYVDNTFRDAK